MELSDDEQTSESVVSQTADDARETRDHPWSELGTITTFDGNGTRLSVSDITGSTLSVNNINRNQNGLTQRVNPSTSILIESLVHQLCAAFEKDQERRKKVYQGICKKLFKAQLIDGSYNMTEFDVLRKQHQDAFYNLFTAACAAAGSEGPLSIPATLPELSRYYREFTEISFIASGGFGKVYKARNCLDRTEYAIKKIIVSSKRMKIINQHLNEVHALAKLNHPNIVPYKAAWIEPSFISRLSADSRSCRTQTLKRSKLRDSKTLKDSSSDENSLNSKNNASACKKSCNTTGKQRVEKIVEESEIQEEFTSDEISFRNSDSDSNSDKNIDITIDDNSDNSDSDTNSSTENTNSQVCTYSNGDQYMTLYIQMALCEQTLENWMRGRINGTPLPVISEVFQQILRGVDYMHSQNVVHHDIKPSNIFISSSGELQIQLGDFGLACPLQGEEYHNVLGTHMYAAPEQLGGKCDPKSDIYSVGIVLTELLILTHTQMELIYIINTLKCGNIPASLPADRYKWAQIIVQMVQEDPQKRPWTQQLLRDINADKDVTITELKNTVMTLKDDINNKEHEIEKLQSEIALLREKLKID